MSEKYKKKSNFYGAWTKTQGTYVLIPLFLPPPIDNYDNDIKLFIYFCFYIDAHPGFVIYIDIRE